MVGPFVLDCSVTMAWCFPDEDTEHLTALRRSLARGSEALVPVHWHLEVVNTLLVAERRGRSSRADSERFIAFLEALPVVSASPSWPQASSTLLALARDTGLSSYDAAYLDLAQRRGVPLATLDQTLRTCAKRLGVPVL